MFNLLQFKLPERLGYSVIRYESLQLLTLLALYC